ncbi:MAG TPA: DUF4349 domain-containing protein [Gemmatimonadaceae bacterium]|nr:DUF4349 domain-containing protein [Gemmatimonadaceae bacterium]
MLRGAWPLLAMGLAASLTLAACNGGESATDASAGAAGQAEFTAPPPPPPAPPMPAPERRAIAGGVAAAKVAAPSAADASAATDALPSSAAQTAAPAMIIRTGTASVEVQDVDTAAAQVRALVARLGGYVANSALQAGRDQVRTAVLEVKVPAARFDAALTGLRPLGTVEVVNVDAQDVGEEYTDLEARVANARRLEERLVELLATRTGKLDDVLAVERELARVREEIERMEGRMRYLRARAAMSTLTVTLHEPLPLAGTGPGDNVIVRALEQAWENFVGVIAWLIAAVGALLPLVLIGAIAWALLRRLGVPLRTPRRAGRSAPPAAPPADA